MSNPESQSRPFGDESLGAALGYPPPPKQDPPMRDFRGNTLHQPFNMRERMKLSREKPMLGIWLGSFAFPTMARFIAQAGWDFVLLDWEHTPMGIESICELIKSIQYAGEGNTAVVVRVPSHVHHWIGWVLDAGASAVILPHVESVEQAKAGVRHARFPPFGGIRSGAPLALQFGYNDGGGGPWEVWNRAGVIMQIESKVGVDCAQEIAAVEGVDGLMLGPGDLAFDLGLDPFAGGKPDPALMECYAKVTAAARDHGLACLCPDAHPRCDTHLDQGFTMVASANDGTLIASALRQNLAQAHEQMNKWKAERGAGGKA